MSSHALLLHRHRYPRRLPLRTGVATLAVCLSALLATPGMTQTLASSPPAPSPAATGSDPEVAKLAASPVAAQQQWLAQAIKSGDLAKMPDAQIVARMQAISAEALARYLKTEAAAMPEYQYQLTRQERLNGQWQTTPDRMMVKIRQQPRAVYAKWQPNGAHDGQEILYDETRRPNEMYGHLGGIMGFTSIWSNIDGTLARSQSNHTVRDLGFEFIADQIVHDGQSFRKEGLSEKPVRTSVADVGGVRVLALEWEAPSGPPAHYAYKSRVLIDLKTGRFRGIEAWDDAGQKLEEMRFDNVKRESWTDATFDAKNPDYKF